MNCQQFQEVLPYVIEGGGGAAEEGHLKSCSGCSDLVRDLQYIAEQAKLLLPMHDPHPRVWGNIEQSLQREGLLREGRMSRLGHIMNNTTALPRKNWTPIGLFMATIAVLALSMVLVNYQSKPSSSQVVMQTPAAPAVAQLTADDQLLLSQVSHQRPEISGTYQDSLQQINSYISDARKAVNEDPGDEAAQEHLMEAYGQRAMLYERGIVRSLE